MKIILPRRQQLEQRADKVLDLLRGYQRRQSLVTEDREVVISILQEWEDEVTTLEQQLTAARQQAYEHRALSRYYERRIAGLGYGAYVRFLLGLGPCPS